MREYNQLKREVLAYLQTFETATSHDVANALTIEIPNAGMVLLKLRRQGLVNRWAFKLGAFKKPQFQYEITNRGRERYAYYMANPDKKGAS